MKEIMLGSKGNDTVIQNAEKHSGVRVTDCYQCGKCSAGCPMAHAMDIMPRQVLHYLQLGLVDEVLKSKTIWICASCHMCTARCPHDIKISALMEALKQEAKKQGKISVKEADRFNEIFLLNLKLFGKSHEMVLEGLYNVSTGHFAQDMPSAPHMIKHKLIRLRPHLVKDRASIRRIMKKAAEMKKEDAKS